MGSWARQRPARRAREATGPSRRDGLCPLSPFLIGPTFASPNIVRDFRRTLLRFLTELIVRRTWFGQFDELYFVS